MELDLPKIPETKSSRNDVELVLSALKDTVETTYNNKILVLLITSSNYNENHENVLSYAVYLSFVNKNKFSYRLFEVNCLNSDGGFPVELVAFYGPAVSFGKAINKKELEEIIQAIFKDEKTRFIILSNYNL